MKRMTQVLVLMVAWVIVPSAKATLLVPGGSGFPGDFTGAPPGTLLALNSAPFTSTLGLESGTIVSAVFREAGGTLDFYYQVTNNATCGVPTCDSLSRETDTNFFGFVTDVLFRTDGSSLPGGAFVNGTVAPATADRDGSADVVGFDFNQVPALRILPGTVSTVLVIRTNATNFTLGNASVIDGGVATVTAFEPTVVPEPTSLLLLGGGLLALSCVRRFRVWVDGYAVGIRRATTQVSVAE